MNIVKVIGIVVLAVLSLSGAFRVLFYGIGLIAVFGSLASEVQSETIGRFIGALLFEILIVYGLFKLIRSMKKKPEPANAG